MEDKELTHETHNSIQQNMVDCRKSDADRRQSECEGYTYVSTVGWICRREHCRRKNGDGSE